MAIFNVNTYRQIAFQKNYAIFSLPSAVHCLPVWEVKKMVTHVCLIFILPSLVKLSIFSYDVYWPILRELFVTSAKVFLQAYLSFPYWVVGVIYISEY